MYNVKWSNIINWMMHPDLKTSFHLNFLNALLKPFKTISEEFNTYVTKVDYKLAHTSQVCSITGMLNDNFDNAERRIYITDGGGLDVLQIDDDSEYGTREVYIINSDSDDVESDLIVYPDSAYEGASISFIINLPSALNLSDSDIYKMKALVDLYKLAGKTYTIETV